MRISTGVLLLVILPLIHSYDGEDICRSEVEKRLNQLLLSPTNASIFYRNEDGIFESDPTKKITLTLSGCKEICGPGSGHTPWLDGLQMISTWLLPVLLLLSNLHFPPLGVTIGVFYIVRAIGNPIDTLWSMLTQREVARRSLAYARHASAKGEILDPDIIEIATVIVALEEIEDTIPPEVSHAPEEVGSTSSFDAKISLLCVTSKDDEAFRQKLNEIAYEISDERVHAMLPTAISILFYLITLGMSFVMAQEAIKKGEKPPGNRVGWAILFSFLVPIVLLSADIGRGVSKGALPSKLRRLIDAGGSEMREKFAIATINDNNRHAEPWTDVGIYRSQKQVFCVDKDDRSSFKLFLLAVSFVFLPSTSAFAIAFITPPVGITCRPLSITIVGSLWLFSVGTSWAMFRFLRKCNSRIYFYAMMIKDSLIAISVVGMIILYFMGLDNSCWCWSAVYDPRVKTKFVELDVKQRRAQLNRTWYPGIVFATLTLQFFIYFLFRWLNGEDKKPFRWREKMLNKGHFNVEPNKSNDHGESTGMASGNNTVLLRTSEDGHPTVEAETVERHSTELMTSTDDEEVIVKCTTPNGVNQEAERGVR